MAADRVSDNFTSEQREWLADMLRPHCCHVTGEHDPTHFDRGAYVCTIQQADRYAALRIALGLPMEEIAHSRRKRPPATEAISDSDCGWCARAKAQDV